MRKTQLSCAIVAALASTSLAAQDTGAPAKLETIEVTATKRSESIQDVPVAVSALDGKALENLGIDNFQDYVEFLPNVVFQGTGPGQNEIYIRGAATTQSSITLSSVQALQPSVAFYLDEMPVSMAGRNLDIFATDVERVEVLPGPQGTLFGASSQAGTVRLITNKPDHSGFSAGFDTSISTTKGGDMSNTVEAYFNFAPTDNLAFRVAAYNESQGGWIDNIENDPNNGGYIGSAVVIDRISGGALQAKGIDPADMDARRSINGFDPSEAAVVSPRNSEHVEDNFNDAVYSGARFGLSYIFNDNWDVVVQHTAQTLDTEGVFAYDPTVEGESSAIRFQGDENSDEFGLTTWTLNGRLEKLDVVYTGGYLDREIDTLTDYTGYTNGGLFSAYYVCTHYETPDNPDDARCLDPTKYYKEDTTSTRLTHELRFSTTMDTPWQLTAGVFYDEQEVASVGQFKIASTEIFTDLARTLQGSKGINSDGGPFSPEISFVNDVTHTIEQIAVFGQLGYEITDTVTATVGARWYQIDDIYRGATSTRDVTSRLEAYGQGVLDPAVYDDLGLDGQGVVDAIQDGSLDIGLLGDDGVLTVDDTIFKFGLDWKVNENVLLFANYSEGFRPPVTNRLGGDAAANNTGAFADFRVPVYSTTDTLDNYEIGLKGDFLDGILRVNATGYYSEISDLQTSRFDPTNISFLVFTDNVGDAEVKGIDADITWLASDNLVINAAFSVLDTELVSINSELEGIAAGVGSKLPYSADFSGNISARYFFELDGGKEGFVNASLTYTGDRLAGMVMNAYAMEDATRLIYGTGSGLKIEDEGEVFNGATYPGADGETIRGGRYIQESYVIGNVSVGMSYESWKVEAFIDNVFDKSAILNIDTQQYTPKVVTNRPRTIGLRFSYDYY
ncbi:TonB-dependent receptor [Alteromonas mediterranea]|uniref:TonB-dependent receptor n=1 Tax=Alteromonas mediterranea TaxID=314275 RepID=A0AAC9J9T2_9ALTE|nr:TonB-dependent receptor [Alteromonas mediterranea]APD89781.1 TonB-dependent receptor [Alteromonas mediterranea]QDG34733.1 TonB-dependent receptor [Alteromonas mediterranea]